VVEGSARLGGHRRGVRVRYEAIGGVGGFGASGGVRGVGARDDLKKRRDGASDEERANTGTTARGHDSRSHTALQQLKQALMSFLFTGELRVTPA
jgi:hypothetical protein